MTEQATAAVAAVELEEIEVWIVVGEMSWGRGEDFKDAFTNWMVHARPNGGAKCSIFRFEGRIEAKEVYVNDFGQLYGPKAERAKMTKLEGFDVTKKMVEAYNAWNWLMDDLQYGGNKQFSDAFDEPEVEA